jgi:hypothetical protein
MSKQTLLILFFVSLSTLASAQDSTQARMVADRQKAAIADYAALMYPRIRQFSITHEENGRGNIHYKMNGKEVGSGDLRLSRTSINFNLPVVTRPNNLVVASLGVIHQFYSVGNVKSNDETFTMVNHETYVPMLSAALTYSRGDSLLGRRFISTVNARSVFSPDMSHAQFTFTGILSTPLIEKPNTRLSVGGVILIDPASPTPFFLSANFFHKFEKYDLDLMLDLPYRAALRKSIKDKASLTLFTELGGSNSFYNTENAGQRYAKKWVVFSTLEMKSGLMAEYRLTKKMVFSLSAGGNYMVNAKVRETNAKPKDYFMKNKIGMVPYVQVGISLLPFWKGLNL